MSWYRMESTAGGEIKDKDTFDYLVQLFDAGSVIEAILRCQTLSKEEEGDDDTCCCFEVEGTMSWIKVITNTDTEHSWTEWEIGTNQGRSQSEENSGLSKSDILKILDEARKLHGNPVEDAPKLLAAKKDSVKKFWAEAVLSGSDTPELDAARAMLSVKAHEEPKVPWDDLKGISACAKVMKYIEAEYATDLMEARYYLAKEAKKK